ncbi:MAG: protein phosphatase CheZ [Pseudomonadota bacterium]
MTESVDLENARNLVKCLEENDQEGADMYMAELTKARESNLFIEVGKLTRELHEALSNFQLDTRISDLAAQDIPDAKDRLKYVIETTEDAANKTMDAVEKSLPMADNIGLGASNLKTDWDKLMNKQMQPAEFRVLCQDMKSYLDDTKNSAHTLHTLLTEVLMAQGYQDLTGQVIRRVIQMVQDVEESLVTMIRMFGSMNDYDDAKDKTKIEDGVEGPIVNKEKRDDVVNSQDDVDDLLSSLGF